MDSDVTRLVAPGADPAAITVPAAVVAALVAAARQAGADECCGLLLGTPGRIIQAMPARNVHPLPARHFEIDPAALIAAYRAERSGGPVLIGFYHSHPNGHPRPSAQDCQHAGGDGRIWAIIAAGAVSWWRDTASGFTEVSVTVTTG